MKAKRTWSQPTLLVHGKVESVTGNECAPAKFMGSGDQFQGLSPFVHKQGGNGDLYAGNLSFCH